MTTSAYIWRQIQEVIGHASKQVILVAPFIKREMLEGTLAAAPASVEAIQCITRWTPEEVAAGVSDPEIIELAGNDKRLSIRLCPPLHAKIYLADDRCLIGSANLTAKATGRTAASNIEILVELPTDHPEVSRVLAEIDACATEATPYMANLMRRQAELLAEQRSVALDSVQGESQDGWYPVTRRPEIVYPYYCGRNDVGRSIEGAILRDLAFLGVPAGLSEAEFYEWIEARLRKIPALQPLVEGKRLSNVELQKALREQTGIGDESAGRAAETIAAWLRHFGRFYTDVGVWEIRHGRELP
ncbi:phospholipase D family protein [Nocardia brasiliensis]|uniref:phospholipase D family protein n=1 Tax=Nocardia brasiliensis TaxID=37326 RepID=UPI003D94309B